MAAKIAYCTFCGAEFTGKLRLKDGSTMCWECRTKYGKSYDVKWDAITKEEVSLLENIPVREEDYPADFTFDSFVANTTEGLFSIKGSRDLFSIKAIKKYYIEFEMRESRSGNNFLDKARMVFELSAPVPMKISQSIQREKEGVLDVFDILNVKGKNSYKKKNEPFLAFLQKATGMPPAKPTTI